MAEMVTRCPECSTSFRITQAQIQKARGAVRCGSCLHIFNAQKHLVDGKPTAAKKASAKTVKTKKQPAPQQEHLDITPPEPPQPTTKQATPSTGLAFDQEQINRESELDDNQLISDNMDAEDTEDEEMFFIEEKKSGHSLFDRKLDDKPDDFIDDTDESWAENLLESDPEPRSSAQSTFDSPLSIVGDEHLDDQPLDAANAISQIKGEPPTDDAPLTEDETDEDAWQSETITGDDSLDGTQSSEPSQHQAPPPPKFHLTREEEPDDNFNEMLSAFDSNRSSMLYNIDPEPVEMAGASARHWKKQLLWSSAIVLALLTLFAQVAWLQFDRFSRQEPYRAYYSSACELLGCQLPAMSDHKSIRTFNLVVRNHPDVPRALVVDAIVLNGATYNQAYPNLQLTFTDINNKPVASRIFKPQEYLKGELSGSKIMPKNQPIHLSLELADPGEAAVNYRLEIQ
ncbi:DUF3426 domain-containing protein [Gilvimarinus sp. 1_MG-2023]|uniref:DUF3426 domain-containing protein n=1 Tax=Gilvimarinus sp. 1_MG-2023 TaxID=3062638 RepID=UPI0026E3107D|nr:DUF3426 domain-containing protein [Gilvimarinus sp. 1_MG-2023]MDO6747464.1 DUF3426 domain-containing protein [Gilvimarinus sp. 1_MG-2023]